MTARACIIQVFEHNISDMNHNNLMMIKQRNNPENFFKIFIERIVQTVITGLILASDGE